MQCHVEPRGKNLRMLHTQAAWAIRLSFLTIKNSSSQVIVGAHSCIALNSRSSKSNMKSGLFDVASTIMAHIKPIM